MPETDERLEVLIRNYDYQSTKAEREERVHCLRTASAS